MIEVESKELVNPQAQTPSLPAIAKRRSSIFQRRSINPRQEDHDETISDHQKSENSRATPPEEPQEKIFDLSDYIASLLHEQRTWRKTLSERKSRRRHLVKEELRVHEGIDLDLTPLADRERSFLSERPNYEIISENLQNLVKVAVQLSASSSEVNHLVESMTDSLNDEISRARVQLIDLSDV